MEKKLRLLKDLPGIKAGRVVTITNPGYEMCNIATDDGKFNGSYNWTNKDWFEEVKEEFKVGRWAIVENAKYSGDFWTKGKVLRIAEVSFNFDNYYLYQSEEDGGGDVCANRCRLATKDEIETHLIAEAKKRGYEHKSFMAANSQSKNVWKVGFDTKYIYDSPSDILELWSTNSITDNNYNSSGRGCLTIYSKGKWAEIIEKKPLKIGDYEVKLTKTSVTIGCKIISYSELDMFCNLVNRLGISEIQSLSHKIVVTKDQINEIRDAIKQL